MGSGNCLLSQMSGLYWGSLGFVQVSPAHRKGANFDPSELADPNPSGCGSSEAEPLLVPADSQFQGLNHKGSVQKLSADKQKVLEAAQTLKGWTA